VRTEVVLDAADHAAIGEALEATRTCPKLFAQIVYAGTDPLTKKPRYVRRDGQDPRRGGGAADQAARVIETTEVILGCV
jgi:hypothetical protein